MTPSLKQRGSVWKETASPIDTRTKAIVQRGMDALTHRRTVFVIAHRLFTVKNSDVIMVLGQGAHHRVGHARPAHRPKRQILSALYRRIRAGIGKRKRLLLGGRFCAHFSGKRRGRSEKRRTAAADSPAAKRDIAGKNRFGR